MTQAASIPRLQTPPSPKRGNPLFVYLKPTDYCNVGCDHCYLPVSVRSDKYRMNEETLEQSIQTITVMAEKQNAAGVLIIWHGGEPLSLPVGYFTSLAQRVEETIENSIQSLQTSLIPYSSRWAGLVETFFGAEIGSSIDFTQRTLKGSAEAYQAFWMKKVEAARADGFRVIPGIVPSRHEVGKGAAITQWMDERGFDKWNIDRYNQFAGHDPLRPTNKEHSAFLTEVFDAVMERAKEGKTISVNTVRAALGGVLFNKPGDRWGGQCSHDFLVINPDGKTNACPDKISHEGFSHVSSGYEGFRVSEERKRWIRLHLLGHRNPDCPTCPFNTFCKSGCPLTPNDVATEGECSGYNRHLHHVQAFAQKNPTLVSFYMREAS